jgi:hypothetical protein
MGPGIGSHPVRQPQTRARARAVSVAYVLWMPRIHAPLGYGHASDQRETEHLGLKGSFTTKMLLAV